MVTSSGRAAISRSMCAVTFAWKHGASRHWSPCTSANRLVLKPLRRGQVTLAPAVGFRLGSSRSKGASARFQIKIGLNQRAKVFGRKQVSFLVLPVLAPAVVERIGLMFLRQTGNQRCMAGGDALLLECLCYCVDKLQQTQPRIDVAGTLAGLLDQRGDVVARKVKQALKALGLFVGVYVFTLRVLSNRHPSRALRHRRAHRRGLV